MYNFRVLFQAAQPYNNVMRYLWLKLEIIDVEHYMVLHSQGQLLASPANDSQMFVVWGRAYLSGALYGATPTVQPQPSILKKKNTYVQHCKVIHSHVQLLVLPTNNSLVRCM